MRLTNRTCVCGCVVEDEPGLRDHEFAEKHGLGMYMNTSNGLTFLYVCQKCDEKAKMGLSVLVEVFGDLAKDLYYSNHLKVINDKAKSDLQDQDRQKPDSGQRRLRNQGHSARRDV